MTFLFQIFDIYLFSVNNKIFHKVDWSNNNSLFLCHNNLSITKVTKSIPSISIWILHLKHHKQKMNNIKISCRSFCKVQQQQLHWMYITPKMKVKILRNQTLVFALSSTNLQLCSQCRTLRSNFRFWTVAKCQTHIMDISLRKIDWLVWKIYQISPQI